MAVRQAPIPAGFNYDSRVMCPICEVTTALGPRCSCGYDRETGDTTVVAEKAVAGRARAARGLRRGLVVLGTIPVTMALFPILPLVSFAAPLQLLFGVGDTIRGWRQYRLASQRLRRVTLPALPPARVIEPGP
jgi:hypothetical protein